MKSKYNLESTLNHAGLVCAVKTRDGNKGGRRRKGGLLKTLEGAEARRAQTHFQQGTEQGRLRITKACNLELSLINISGERRATPGLNSLRKKFLIATVPQRLEAAVDFATTARVELVPFPKPARSGVFFASCEAVPFHETSSSKRSCGLGPTGPSWQQFSDRTHKSNSGCSTDHARHAFESRCRPAIHGLAPIR